MLDTDDILKTINDDFLGFRGKTFPWRARFIAYGIGPALMVGAIALMRVLHVPSNPGTLLTTVGIDILVTRWIGRKITHELPFRAMLTVFWHEVTAPRPERPKSSHLVPAMITFTRPVVTVEQPLVEDDTDDVDRESQPVTSAECQVAFHDGCRACACPCHEE